MTSAILDNIKGYITERNQQLIDRYECTHSDYARGKLDGLEEIINYITGEEMYLLPDRYDETIQ